MVLLGPSYVPNIPLLLGGGPPKRLYRGALWGLLRVRLGLFGFPGFRTLGSKGFRC